MKSSTVPFQVVLKLLLRWWWLILISVALGAGVGYFIRTKQPDIYNVVATVWFGQDVGKTSNSQDALSFTELQELISVYAGLARRDAVLQPVIDKLNLGITVDALNKVLTVIDGQDLPVLDVVISDLDPVRGANIANAIADQLVEQSGNGTRTQQQAFQSEQLRSVQAQITQLKTSYDNYVAEGANLSSAFEIAQNLTNQNQTLAALQEARRLYADMSAGLSETSNGARILNPAIAANALKVASSLLSVILSGVAGLVLSLATIILIGYFDDRLQWHEGMEEVMGVKTLGPLGNIPKNKLPLYVVTMPESIESEVLRQLRAKLILAAGGVQPKVVTVTSYDSGDGKTITTSNLAMASAQAGLRTLVIDGDLRKGDLHEVFQLPNVMGLSDILASHDDAHVLLSRAVLDSGYDDLAVLTSGRSTADAASLVSKPRFVEVLDTLKRQFDVIVMDSVPTIGGPDAAFMAEVSDGVLVVVHGQRTTHKGLNRTIQLLRQGGKVNIYGLAFNHIALQVTSTYNQPYYRKNLAIDPEHLNRELLNAGKRGSIFNFNRNVIVGNDGTRLYTYAAAAVQLGISEEALKGWVTSGYIRAERHGRRRWVRETEIATLLDKLPRHEIRYTPAPPPAPAPTATESTKSGKNNKTSSGKIPDLLQGQRDALLASAREAKPADGSDE